MEFVRVGRTRRDPRGRDAGATTPRRTDDRRPHRGPSVRVRRRVHAPGVLARRGSSTTAPRRSSARATAASSTWRTASRSRVPAADPLPCSGPARSTAGSRWPHGRARGRLPPHRARAPHDERRPHPVRPAARPDPDRVVQHHARHREVGHRAAAPAEPADEAADRSRRPRAAVPDVADRPGGLDRRVDRHPGRGDRRLPAVEAVAAVPRDAARAGAADAGAHLLQVRGRLAGRQPQAEHRGAAGLLQQAGRHPPHRDRDRRGAVGLRHGARLPDVRPEATCTW